MQERERNILIGVLAFIALLLICGASFAAYQIFFNRPEPTQNPALAYTQAAQTIVADLTQEAGSTAIAQLTQIASPGQTLPALPTDTPAPTFSPPTQPSPTLAVPPTSTPWVVPTWTTVPLPPTFTSPPIIPCNRATFVKDVTIPDGATLPPNTPFTKIWRVRNDGSCFWDASYAVVFSNGTAMTNNRTILIPGTIPPSGTVDIAVDMVSPGAAGTYQSNWLFRAPNGAIFGLGPSGSNPLFTRIRVLAQPQPNPSYAYDFSANYCNAQWRSEGGIIGCTNPINDARGSVSYLTVPELETRTENEPGLWTRPNQAANGFISGQYPPYLVKPGDRFVAELSCQYGWSACDITFRLDYLLPNGSAGNLGAWREIYDNRTNIVSIDLGPLVGQSVQFILRMQNNGNPAHANGIWFLPSIRNSPPTNTPLPPTVTPTPTATLPPRLTPTETPTEELPPRP